MSDPNEISIPFEPLELKLETVPTDEEEIERLSQRAKEL